MRKLVSIIILLGIAWLAKLSYDMWQISRTVPELQQSLMQSEQQYANLNDQLVALKDKFKPSRVVMFNRHHRQIAKSFMQALSQQ